MLREPTKQDVVAWDGSRTLPREVTLLLTERDTLRVGTVIVDLTAGKVVSHEELDLAAVGFEPCFDEDYEIVKSDPGWLEAIARREITDVERVRPSRCPPVSSATTTRSARVSTGCSPLPGLALDRSA